MRQFKTLHILSLLLIFLIIGLTGCENGNLFGKLNDLGDSGDVDSLVSDANIALQAKDYGLALSLYERALLQDPRNSLALYGAAAAAIGSSGVNFGQLISNISNQTNSSSVQGLADALSQSREIISVVSGDSSDSLLYGIDRNRLNSVIDLAICRLRRIVSGGGDGVRSANDIDVLVNLGFLYVVRGALRPINAGILDIRNVNGTYGVVVDPPITANVCNGTDLLTGFSNADEQQEFFRLIARDLAYGYSAFYKAATLLNVSSDQIMRQIMDDIQTAADELKVDADIDAFCLGLFNSEASPLYRPELFSTPPSGC